MSTYRACIFFTVIIFILAGCSSASKSKEPEVVDEPEVIDAPKALDKPQDLNPGGALFSEGITYYEEGKYALAEKNLKDSLALGLADTGDKVTAHKYLAFLYCVSSRKTLCKNEFKNAFELDPGFTLSPAEAGHPIWSKIYRQVKNQMTPGKKKSR